MPRYTYGELEFEPYEEGGDRFIEKSEGFSSRLHINKNTGHIQFHPMPSQELLARYYNGAFTRSEEGPKPETEFVPRVLDIVTALKGYLQSVGGMPDTFTYHDIGCGFGAGVWGGSRRAYERQVTRRTKLGSRPLTLTAITPYRAIPSKRCLMDWVTKSTCSSRRTFSNT